MRRTRSCLCVSGRLQIDGRDSTVLAGLSIERDSLPLDEFTHTGRLNRRDMHEDVLGAILGLNESKAFGNVEELDDTDAHRSSSWGIAEPQIGLASNS